MAEIDSLLQTVMFTIYGNQYESREEHLLLTMFQVSPLDLQWPCSAKFSPVCINLPIRQHPRILLPPPREYTRLSNDDHIYTKRSWAELSQDSAS